MRRRPEVGLRRLPVAQVQALADGTWDRAVDWHPQFPAADTRVAARLLLEAFTATATPTAGSPWWLYAVLVDGVVGGAIGFHGPPDGAPPYEVEIGYEVVPALRGRGVATRACGLLLALAWRHGADVVLADAEPENVASRAVLRSHGFRSTAAGGFAVRRPEPPT